MMAAVKSALLSCLTSSIVSFILAFPIMLTLGALHIQWHQIPALGWWTTYLFVFTLYVVSDAVVSLIDC